MQAGGLAPASGSVVLQDEDLTRFKFCYSECSLSLLFFYQQGFNQLYLQVEDYEEEPLLRTGCKEYFWLLCKLIDNIHVKDASQVGTKTTELMIILICSQVYRVIHSVVC